MNFADNIDYDLGVAAAIVGGKLNDSRFNEVNNPMKSSGFTYGDDALKAAFGATESDSFDEMFDKKCNFFIEVFFQRKDNQNSTDIIFEIII